MDAAKKTAIEQRIVIGLGMVFLLAFLTGPAKRFGLFGRSAPAMGSGAPAGTIDVSQPVVAVLRQDGERQAPTPEPAPLQEPGASPAYTAFALRDPLRSLLLEHNPRPVFAIAQGAGDASPGSVSQPHPPLPPLRIQGIVWGGTEPKAIIDNQVYGVHDVVAGAQILQIDGDGVLVDHYGTPHRYTLASPTQQQH